MTELRKKVPKRASPHPIPEWEEAARRLLRAEMALRGWRYQRLALELKVKLGIDETAAQVSRKVNRGKFSAGFLIACLKVMGVSELRVGDASPSSPPKEQMASTL